MPKPLQQKREEAAVRQASYNALTDEQKLIQCFARQGNSHKEVKRINKRLGIGGKA